MLPAFINRYNFQRRFEPVGNVVLHGAGQDPVVGNRFDVTNAAAVWCYSPLPSTREQPDAGRIDRGAADTWGRTWASGDFSNANFRVRITDVASSTSRDFSLDWVGVQVSYTP